MTAERVLSVLQKLSFDVGIKMDINNHFYLSAPHIDLRIGSIQTSPFKFRCALDSLRKNIEQGWLDLLKEFNKGNYLVVNSKKFVWDDCIWREL